MIKKTQNLTFFIIIFFLVEHSPPSSPFSKRREKGEKEGEEGKGKGRVRPPLGSPPSSSLPPPSFPLPLLLPFLSSVSSLSQALHSPPSNLRRITHVRGAHKGWQWPSEESTPSTSVASLSLHAPAPSENKRKKRHLTRTLTYICIFSCTF